MIGITLDTIDNLEDVVFEIRQLPYRVAVRLVCDPGNDPSFYWDAFVRLQWAKCIIVLQPIDSAEVKDFALKEYLDRYNAYLQLFKTADYIEVGNEINGDWLGPYMMEKVNNANYLAKSLGFKTMITMFADNDPLAWLSNYKIETAPDLSGLSIYPNQWDKAPDIGAIFKGLARLWPLAEQVIGEFGWEGGQYNDPQKTKLIYQYYTYRAAVTNYSVGGFYWDTAEELNLVFPVLKSLTYGRD